MENHEKKTTTVAIVNNTPIVVIENGEKRIAVRPICQALGIDFTSQLKRLKRDEILSSVVVTMTTTGSDGKRYEMITIPFKFVFGWLFTIDTSKVRPEVKDAVIKYKIECYNALYEHFVEMDEYLRWRNRLAEEKFAEVERAREEFKMTKSRLEALKKEFAEVRAITFDDFRQNKAQLQLDFPPGEEKEAAL